MKVRLAKGPVCEASMASLAGSRCVSSSACCAAWVACAACCRHPRWKVARATVFRFDGWRRSLGQKVREGWRCHAVSTHTLPSGLRLFGLLRGHLQEFKTCCIHVHIEPFRVCLYGARKELRDQGGTWGKLGGCSYQTYWLLECPRARPFCKDSAIQGILFGI